VKAELIGDVIHFEGTEEEFAVFMQVLEEKMRASVEEFVDELLPWHGTSTVTAPEGLMAWAEMTR